MVKKEKLLAIPVLSNLSEEEVTSLGSVMTEVKVTKGTYLIHAEDESRSIMFIFDGKVKVSLPGNEARDVILAYLERGDFFGEIALLTGEKRTADVIAENDTTALLLTEADFKRHVQKYSGFSMALLSELAHRIRDSSEKIGELVLFDVNTRLARTLRSMGTKKVIDGETVYILDTRPTHQDLASLIGTSREVVSRAFKKLEDDGFIATDGKAIKVYSVPSQEK